MAQPLGRLLWIRLSRAGRVATMQALSPMRLLSLLFLASALAGCAGRGQPGLGSDGSSHPDMTQGIADYTGQGSDGEGWAGNSDGEGGPSAVPESPKDRVPR